MTDIRRMSRETAALERLHRARCIVDEVAFSLLAVRGDKHLNSAAAALNAASELILQCRAVLERDEHIDERIELQKNDLDNRSDPD